MVPPIIVKVESIFKDFKVSLKGWFSNLNFLNKNKITLKIDKKTQTTNIGELNQTIIYNTTIIEAIPDATHQLKVAKSLKQLKNQNPIFLSQDIATSLELPTTGSFNEELNKRIDEVVALMNLSRLDQAKENLLTILGEVKSNSAKFSKELARVYNNLGVIYNQPKPNGDYDKAIEYFNFSITQNASLMRAKINLANALMNKGDSDSINKGTDQASALWAIEKTSDILIVLLWGLYQKNKDSKVIFDFIEKDIDAKEISKTSDKINNLLASLYLEKIDFENALKYANRSIEISPDEPEVLSIKAKALLIRAQEKYSVESEFEIVPKLTDFEDVNEALKLFTKAKEVAEQEKKSYLLTEIEYGIYTCLVWLGRYDESKYKLKTLVVSDLQEKMAHHVNVMSFAVDLYNKDYELAYNGLINDKNYDKLSYAEKRRISRVFLLNGATEQANQLLDQIALEAEQKKDISYWSDLSTIYILLNKHQDAISAAKRMKKMGDDLDDSEQKKIIYSHYNAVMYHYSTPEDGENSETSRLLEGMWEFQKEFPKEKIITPIQAQDEKGELTQEIKDMLLSLKDRYEKIKKSFKDNPVPIYHLEKILNRPFADLMAYREDPDFTIQFTGLDKVFVDDMKDNFEKADGFVFDYLSLLDLSKMGFLGFLEKLGKPIYIHELLFNKIQEELLKKEIEELRLLWDFIRKSKSIKIIRDQINFSFKGEKLEELFDSWLVETLKIAASKKIVLVTNDLRLYSFSKSEDIKPSNILPFINKWLDQGYIDNKMYSRSLGDLAERYYVFLAYKAEDLFEIVLEDKGKITLRSYHLVRQIFLPGSVMESFMGVFIGFIGLFWKTGSLPQEKVAWIKFLTNIITEIMDTEFAKIDQKNITETAVSEVSTKLKPYTTGLGEIWKIAINTGSKDDLSELIKIIDEVFDKIYLKKSKEFFRKNITDKIQGI